MKKTMIILISVLSLVITFNGVTTTGDTSKISRGTVIERTEKDSITSQIVVDTINVIDSLNLSEYNQVYWWSKYWGEKYNVPYEILLTIAWKETGWGSLKHWIPIESYSIQPGGRMDKLNSSCHGVMQVITPTANSISKMYNVQTPTRSELRYNIKVNIHMATLLVKYLWDRSKDIYSVFMNYNGSSWKVQYANETVNHLKQKYNLTQKDILSKMLTK